MPKVIVDQWAVGPGRILCAGRDVRPAVEQPTDVGPDLFPGRIGCGRFQCGHDPFVGVRGSFVVCRTSAFPYCEVVAHRTGLASAWDDRPLDTFNERVGLLWRGDDDAALNALDETLKNRALFPGSRVLLAVCPDVPARS